MVLTRALSSLIRNVQGILAPGLFKRYKLKQILEADSEFEISALLPYLSTTKIFIDIGAGRGEYSLRFAPFCSQVQLFEPLHYRVREIIAISKEYSNVYINEVALSDSEGVEKFEVNLISPGLSRLVKGSKTKLFSKVIDVKVQTLDSYNLRNISAIKIDVEGNELFVLNGAKNTLKKERPVVLCESEGRWSDRSPHGVFEFFNDLFFDGYFFWEKKRMPISEFKVQIHQNPANAPSQFSGWSREKPYVNNFLFIPRN